MIDVTFDVYSDTPPGRDPDSRSPTLRRFHQKLWSKLLPGGDLFALTTDQPGIYLYHKSRLGEFRLSSDSISHTYRYVRRMSHIVSQVPEREMTEFFRLCSTIGGYTIFPSGQVDGKKTINAARGLDARLGDRFDLTLECIRRHYLGQSSPLSDTLMRYAPFFGLFGDFTGYLDFFLLQDMVEAETGSIQFWLPFTEFSTSPFPASLEEYRLYQRNLSAFISARNRRILLGSDPVGA